MRPRFSLRTLLALTTALALFCYYWVIMPTRTAQKFLDAVKSSDFVTADECFRDSKDRYYAKLHAEYWTFKLQVNLEQRSLSEFLRGERRVSYQLSFGGPRPVIARGGTIISTAGGLQSPQDTSFAFGGMAM